MRASRLLSIQMLLQARGRMSARALAEALEVSVRSVHRDVDQLSAAGVPIYAERGRHGGFALLEGWKTTLTGLTPAEAQAVFLSGLAGPAAQLGLAEPVRNAQLKLLLALPASWRDEAQTIASRLHLDPVDWYRDEDAVPLLPLVAEAVWGERQLSLRYESWKQVAARSVGPLGLVLKAGIWYLVALLGGEPRTFRISNILEAQLREERVRRPRGFELGAYWKASTERFERGLYQGRARVLATAEGCRALRQLSRAVAQAVAQAEARAEDGVPVSARAGAQRGDGRLRIELPIESEAHACAQLLRLAPEVEVLEPASLRAAIVARLREAARCYRLPIGPARAAPRPGPARPGSSR